MLDSTQIESRILIMGEIDKLIEKYSKKAEKEKAKKNNASVTYQGEKYRSEAELMDAYACDAFSSATYDRLIAKLSKARGSIDQYALTPSECLVIELSNVKANFQMELIQDDIAKKRKADQEARAAELQAEGYSFREAEAIMANEERMRFE